MPSQLSLVKVFLTFFSISIKNEVLVIFQGFRNHIACVSWKNIFYVFCE